ncbi:CHC2 zinc finger domain-containing protein [Pelagicoccus sp. SDUM812003]|uniref:CHC2 zinc finger domain-containing protein n=1 Tax=Pelagicoccus sp. SDUM812003 TaxID=3041267 RepID=UPI00280EFA14|nr:CHC2 zinc finger domain-containing protein [Pelagicoccus sp. SDUM812003]MDQ8201482.1 CHC2 zinc finger domain-containing protein [Pelagicoccus sp. SDUM812003]
MKKIIKKSSIEALKQVASLTDLISDDVQLTRVGDYYVAPSPFVGTRPMTLCINPDVNRWRCKATGKHGDVIEYFKLAYRLPFIVAVEALAKRCGFRLEYEGPTGPFGGFPQAELPLEAA